MAKFKKRIMELRDVGNLWLMLECSDPDTIKWILLAVTGYPGAAKQLNRTQLMTSDINMVKVWIEDYSAGTLCGVIHDYLVSPEAELNWQINS